MQARQREGKGAIKGEGKGTSGLSHGITHGAHLTDTSHGVDKSTTLSRTAALSRRDTLPQYPPYNSPRYNSLSRSTLHTICPAYRLCWRVRQRERPRDREAPERGEGEGGMGGEEGRTSLQPIFPLSLVLSLVCVCGCMCMCLRLGTIACSYRHTHVCALYSCVGVVFMCGRCIHQAGHVSVT